jgi:hypothetical protein
VLIQTNAHSPTLNDVQRIVSARPLGNGLNLDFQGER